MLHFNLRIHKDDVAFGVGTQAPFSIDIINEKALIHRAYVAQGICRNKATGGDDQRCCERLLQMLRINFCASAMTVNIDNLVMKTVFMVLSWSKNTT